MHGVHTNGVGVHPVERRHQHGAGVGQVGAVARGHLGHHREAGAQAGLLGGGRAVRGAVLVPGRGDLALRQHPAVLQRLGLLGERVARRLGVVQALLDGGLDLLKVGLLEDVLLDGKVLRELEAAPATVPRGLVELRLLAGDLLQIQTGLLLLGAGILKQVCRLKIMAPRQNEKRGREGLG